MKDINFFLAGVYWLNKTITPPPFQSERIVEICNSIVQSGREYSRTSNSPFPLIYQYHGTLYLGAAHGLSSILHMLLESPWYNTDEQQNAPLPKECGDDIKTTIDKLLCK